MEVDPVIVLIGGALFALGVFSRPIKRLFMSSALLAVGIGIIFGPEGLAVIEFTAEETGRKVMEEVARVTLAIALMASGLQVTRGDLRENARRCVSLLTLGMIGMWVVTGLGAWLLLDVPFWVGFLIGAILTPTDPVVASTVVTGPLATSNLSRRVRRTLQIESGVNDGLALPFVLLGIHFSLGIPGEGIGDWALEAGREVGLAAVLGGAIGYAAGWLTELSLRDSESEQPNLWGTGTALALLTLGAVHLLGGSGILAVFIAAIAFNSRLEEKFREQVEETQETVTRFFILPAFILFGAILPWSAWMALGIPALAFAAWALLLRRPPVVWTALARTGTPRRERGFLTWFGPIGVAAIYYATLADSSGVPQSETVFAAASLAILTSIFVHAVTATPGVRLTAGRSPLATLRHPLRADSEAAP